jgi:hypothetical protein
MPGLSSLRSGCGCLHTPGLNHRHSGSGWSARALTGGVAGQRYPGDVLPSDFDFFGHYAGLGLRDFGGFNDPLLPAVDPTASNDANSPIGANPNNFANWFASWTELTSLPQYKGHALECPTVIANCPPYKVLQVDPGESLQWEWVGRVHLAQFQWFATLPYYAGAMDTGHLQHIDIEMVADVGVVPPDFPTISVADNRPGFAYYGIPVGTTPGNTGTGISVRVRQFVPAYGFTVTIRSYSDNVAPVGVFIGGRLGIIRDDFPLVYTT